MTAELLFSFHDAGGRQQHWKCLVQRSEYEGCRWLYFKLQSGRLLDAWHPVPTLLVVKGWTTPVVTW